MNISSSLPPYYPDSATLNEQGLLEVSDYNLLELADRFGTPLYVLDEQTIRNTTRRYTAALKEHYPNSLPLFACKALCIQGVLAILAQEGFGLDVVSAGELYTAQSIGFPAEKIYLHGNNKSREELQMAAEYRGCKVVIDNFREIALLRELAQPVEVLLRVTPGVECHTHEYIKTGHLDSKFGFDLEQLESAVQQVLAIPTLKLLGLHAHIGSQIFQTVPYQDAARILLEQYKHLQDKYGLTLRELNLGGGLGIHYTEADSPPSIELVIEQIARAVQEEASRLQLETPRLLIEPGRSIVGRAGLTLYTTGASKQVPGGSFYLAVDGGMADNPRPITYQAQYQAALVREALPSNGNSWKKYTLAGRYCESGDILIRDLSLPADVAAGEVLAVFGTGAYNYSMASNYNRVPRPAMVILQGGEAELLVRRESLEELIGLDVLPSRFCKGLEGISSI